MLTGIDHLVVAVDDPDTAADQLGDRLGLEPGGGGRHDRLGTFNRLVWLGDTYIELIGVFDRDLAAASWVGAPTLRALDTGGGLATWAMASDDLDADVARLRAAGSALAEPVSGERRRADGDIVRWRLSAQPTLGPDLPPFLIEHDMTAAEWTPDDRAVRARGSVRLAVLELGVDDVNRALQANVRAVGLRARPSLAGGGARDSDVGRQVVRWRRRAGPDAPRANVHLTDDRRGEGDSIGRDGFDEVLFGVRWRMAPLPRRG